MKNLHNSIRFKLAAGIFLAFILISSVLNFYLQQRIERNLIDIFNESVKIEGGVILKEINNDPASIPLTTESQPFQIWHTNTNVLELKFERADFPQELNTILPDLLRENGGLSFDKYWVINLDGYTIFIGSSVDQNALNTMNILVLAKSSRRVNAQLSTIKQQVFISSVAAAILSFIIALFLSKSLLNPIKKLAERSKAIKPGLKMDRLPVGKSKDEINALSKTINQMIDNIESSIVNQNQFFNSAAHELRTPLSNMQSEIDLQLQQSPNDEVLQSLKHEVNRLKYVVQDFLLLSQLKQETLTVDFQVLRFDDLLYDVLEKMNHQITSHGLNLQLDVKEDNTDFSILADKAKTESILINLIGNATLYSDNSEALQIELWSSSDKLLVQFINYIDHHKTKNKGNELGLWICTELAKRQNFDFHFEDKKETFLVLLTIPLTSHNSRH